MNIKYLRELLLPGWVILLYLFLYIPLFILILFSFNAGTAFFEWTGFSIQWYAALFNDAEVWHPLYNSLIVALSSVFLCLTMSALFIFFATKRFAERFVILFYGNLAISEIVLAVGLMSLFYFLSVPLSLTTLIAGHTVLGLGYVIPILYDRYTELDARYMDASLDLGATQWQTFRWVVLPLLYPALFTSAILVFIISFEDFTLSFFCSGGSTVTLPMYIFAKMRSGSSPVISALSTLLLVLSGFVVSAVLYLQSKAPGEDR